MQSDFYDTEEAAVLADAYMERYSETETDAAAMFVILALIISAKT